MDGKKRELRGSPNRDAFKQWHKTLSNKFYASDLDFVLVEKYPPGIVAVFDYKLSGSLDSVSFAEVIAYNAFLDWGVPVYIVWSQEPFDRFTIQKFKSGDWKPDPPIVDLDTLLLDVPAETFEEWEANLRRVYRKGIKLVA